ncbi:chorismate mutase [Piscirickettsia salmonis]|uniref:chorismate mutase n=1 Tax=Piscirickettsia salmonis TaxID=1238 RepID=UPI0007C96E47|nr:chorismate mutase [Piscirickettsiaceae bacterium NZ-RLO1]
MKKVLFALLFALYSSSFCIYAKPSSTLSTTTQSQQLITQLIQLIQQREAVMKDVAAFKYNHNLSPYDAKRERVVLTHIEKQLDNHQKSVAILINRQILMDISKQIEAYWINFWKMHLTIKPIAQHNLQQIRNIITATDQKITNLIKQIQTQIRNNINFSQEIYQTIDQEFKLKEINIVYKKMLASSLAQVININ